MAARGALRRSFIRAREAVEDWYVAARSDLNPVKSLSLYRFDRPEDIQRFIVTTDRVLGGNSVCSFTQKTYANFTSAVFSGVIDFKDDNPQSRGGFASARTNAQERVRDLATFEAIEMRIKSDGRPYIFNIKCADFGPEHLWQMRVVAPPGKWTTVAVPFRELMLTRRGRVEMDQQEISRDAISGIGFLLADGRNGPFRLETQYVRAIRDFRPDDYLAAPHQMIENAESRWIGDGRAGMPEPHVNNNNWGEADDGLAELPSRPARTAAQEAEDEKARLREFYRRQREDARLK